MVQLPDGHALPSWTYTVVSAPVTYCLDGTKNFINGRIQIDCYANPDAAADAIRLGRAIDNVLSGFRGTLGDQDKTIVYGCFRSDIRDYFNEAARNYRRMLEYEIDYLDAPLASQ